MSGFDVDILDNTTLAVVGHCYGPTSAGHCDNPKPDGVVGCAGCRIASPDAGPEHWLLWVPDGSRHCPLTWDLEYVGM
jgi:hypothetical protein